MLIFIILQTMQCYPVLKQLPMFLSREHQKFAVFRLECCLTCLTGLLSFVNVSVTQHMGVCCCSLQTCIGHALCQNNQVQDAHYLTRITQYMRLTPAGKHVDYFYCAQVDESTAISLTIKTAQSRCSPWHACIPQEQHQRLETNCMPRSSTLSSR